MPGFVKGAWVSKVMPSRYDAATVYVASDAHRLNDYDTHIWVSHDFGATFQSLNGNLKGEAVKTLTEDQRNQDVIYAGTETGLFVSLDRGKSWSRLRGNFPDVRVDEITLHPRDNAMLLATHGRSLWILDHISPIQEYTAAQGADAHLFSIDPALQWRSYDDKNDEFWGHQFFVGENPPTDAVIQYFLKSAAKEVKLKITDSLGKDVRTLTVAPARLAAGIQTACWDMRVEPIAAPGGAGAAPPVVDAAVVVEAAEDEAVAAGWRRRSPSPATPRRTRAAAVVAEAAADAVVAARARRGRPCCRAHTTSRSWSTGRRTRPSR